MSRGGEHIPCTSTSLSCQPPRRGWTWMDRVEAAGPQLRHSIQLPKARVMTFTDASAAAGGHGGYGHLLISAALPGSPTQQQQAIALVRGWQCTGTLSPCRVPSRLTGSRSWPTADPSGPAGGRPAAPRRA